MRMGPKIIRVVLREAEERERLPREKVKLSRNNISPKLKMSRIPWGYFLLR